MHPSAVLVFLSLLGKVILTNDLQRGYSHQNETADTPLEEESIKNSPTALVTSAPSEDLSSLNPYISAYRSTTIKEFRRQIHF